MRSTNISSKIDSDWFALRLKKIALGIITRRVAYQLSSSRMKMHAGRSAIWDTWVRINFYTPNFFSTRKIVFWSRFAQNFTRSTNEILCLQVTWQSEETRHQIAVRGASADCSKAIVRRMTSVKKGLFARPRVVHGVLTSFTQFEFETFFCFSIHLYAKIKHKLNLPLWNQK